MTYCSIAMVTPMLIKCSAPETLLYPWLTSAWLAQLAEHQSVVREVEGLSPRPDQHSGSENN